MVFCFVLLEYAFSFESLRHLQHVAESSKSSADQDDGALESRRTVTSSLSGSRSSSSTEGTGSSSILSSASINRGSSRDLLSGGRGGDGLCGGFGGASVVGNILGCALCLDGVLAAGLAEGVVWVGVDALGEGGLADVEWDGVLVLGKVLWGLAVAALAVPAQVSLG